MATINQLSVLSSPSAGDQIPVYSVSNGDARRLSLSSLVSYISAGYTNPGIEILTYTPIGGNIITLPDVTKATTWIMLEHAGSINSLTINMPLASTTPDCSDVLITSIKGITGGGGLTLGLNGASYIQGYTNPTSTAAYGRYQFRFSTDQNSWYRVG